MARLKRLYLGGKLLDLPHPFEEELGWIVSTNHKLLMENISRIEDEADDTSDHFDFAELHTNSDELRRAAHNLALVGLITRFDHWLSLFVEELSNKNARIGVVRKLTTLNERIGEGPIPIDFFENLITVRDSVIHADTKIEWEFSGKKRRVVDRYANVSSGEIEFTQAHLQEAIEKSIQQVKWYDDQLDALNSKSES